MVSTLEERILYLLDYLKDERLFEISELVKSETQVLPVAVLAEFKSKVLNLATSAPDLFYDAAVFYYAKFIQSVQIADFAMDDRLISGYIKTIGVMKIICSKKPLCKVNFNPFLKIISDHIKDTWLIFERIEEVFEFSQIPKVIDNEEFEKIKKTNIFVKSFEKHEEILLINYLLMIEVRENYQVILLRNEEILFKNVLPCLNKKDEAININSVGNALDLSNETFFKINLNTLCNEFGINLDIILASETSENLQKFSPIFESHFIGHANQFKLWGDPTFFELNHKSVWPAVCLLNQKQVCVKIYQDYYPEAIEQWRTRVELVKNLSEKGKIHFKYFGSFVNGKDYYLVIDLCINSLRSLIDHELVFSNSDLAYFVHSLIKGLHEIKIDENPYHVDIKPSNIVITYDYEFKIRDYKTSEKFSTPRLAAGNHGYYYEITWEYRGPEMCEPLDETLNTWELSDVYSLGLIILEIYSRKFIAEYRRRNQELFNYILKENLAKIRIPWLSRLLKHMLAENFKKRPRFENLLLMIKGDQEFMKDKWSYKQSWAKKKQFRRIIIDLKFFK